MTAVGAQVIALLALSDDDAPVYHYDNAAALGVLGFACIPDGFSDLMAAAIERWDGISGWARRAMGAGVQGRSAVASSGRSAFLQGELYGLSAFYGPAACPGLVERRIAQTGPQRGQHVVAVRRAGYPQVQPATAPG